MAGTPKYFIEFSIDSSKVYLPEINHNVALEKSLCHLFQSLFLPVGPFSHIPLSIPSAGESETQVFTLHKAFLTFLSSLKLLWILTCPAAAPAPLWWRQSLCMLTERC